MTNEEQTPKRFSWIGVVLLIGHLAIIAGLGVSALTDRPQPPPRPFAPGMSILDSFQGDAAPTPR